MGERMNHLRLHLAVRIAQWNRLRFDKIGLLLGLILLVMGISLFSRPFRSLDNISLILMEAAFIGLVAAGQTVVVLTGGIDLSVGSMVALTGIVTAMLMKGAFSILPPLPAYLAIGCGLGLGLGIGWIHGHLIAKLNMPAFIVTLVSLGVLRSISLVLTNSSSVNALPGSFKWMANAKLIGAPMPGVIMILAYLILWFVLRNTKLGRYTYAIGGNEVAARLSGVPVEQYKTYAYMLNGFLAALASIILIARLDGAIYTNGEGYELSSIAAVIIGGTSLQGGIGSIWGTLIGVLIIAVVRNGMIMLNISYQWQGIIVGVVILTAVFLDLHRQRTRQSAPKIQLSPPVGDKTHLDHIISQLKEIIDEQVNARHIRVYLTDPTSRELVEYDLIQQTWHSIQPESLACQVKKTRQPVVAKDVSLNSSNAIRPLNPQIKSAAAIPLNMDNQIIGVLEVQSTAPLGFNESAIQELSRLTADVALPLNNAWLLECGWLSKQIRLALRHLWDDVYLEQNPLTDWFIPAFDRSSVNGVTPRGVRLRQHLLDAIDELNAVSNQTDMTERRYRILHLTYVDGRAINEVTKELAISRRQYFYDQKDAIDTLAYSLLKDYSRDS